MSQQAAGRYAVHQTQGFRQGPREHDPRAASSQADREKHSPARPADFLHPIIYGQDGNGGLNSIFHPNHDPVVAATEKQTTATLQNSAAIAAMTAMFAASMGVAAPSIPGMAGIPGMSMPSISAPASMPSIINSGGVDQIHTRVDPFTMVSVVLPALPRRPSSPARAVEATPAAA